MILSKGHFESYLLMRFLLRYNASKDCVFTHINHFHTIFATLLSLYLLNKYNYKHDSTLCFVKKNGPLKKISKKSPPCV